MSSTMNIVTSSFTDPLNRLQKITDKNIQNFINSMTAVKDSVSPESFGSTLGFSPAQNRTRIQDTVTFAAANGLAVYLPKRYSILGRIDLPSNSTIYSQGRVGGVIQVGGSLNNGEDCFRAVEHRIVELDRGQIRSDVMYERGHLLGSLLGMRDMRLFIGEPKFPRNCLV
jgi:hypothetical protein